MSEFEEYNPGAAVVPAPTVIPLLTVDERLTQLDAKLDQLIAGVNVIGSMINQVYEGFGQMMAQVQSGGLGSLLGGMMGGKRG